MIHKMATSISHRGPDDMDVFVSESIGLGFTRLSIIGLHDGAQPMASQDGRYILVFNGEVYNYQVLKEELATEGYAFKTNSDTEVILALFELGVEFPETRLRGMFAFAIYDTREKKLILSRDCMGKKPLFWTSTQDGVLFGSEIKALLVTNIVAREPNWPAISDFLTLSYIPGTETAFKNVYHVPPGSRLTIQQEVVKQTWWELPSYKEADKQYTPDWDSKVLNELKSAVKYRLVSDVPLGLFLSGGVDSALILSLISDIGFPKEFTAFTMGFDDSNFDETTEAKKLADLYGIKHVTLRMRPEDIKRIFSDVVYKSDNLLANPAIFANYLLSETASKQVKAAFHGGGGDELFFGYDTYRADLIADYLAKTPKIITRSIKFLVDCLPASHAKLGLKYKAVKFLEGLHLDPQLRHYWWRTIFTERDKDQLLAQNVSRHDSFKTYSEAFAEFSGDDFLEGAAFADMKVWWGSMGLYQGDTMSMANSLEIRMPFMDKELLSIMARIPRKVKFKDNRLKGFLKHICGKYLPTHVLNRPKSGFHVPLAEWFKGPLREFVEEELSEKNIKTIPELQPKVVRKVIDDHMSRKFDNSFKIINLLVLVNWHKTFIL